MLAITNFSFLLVISIANCTSNNRNSLKRASNSMEVKELKRARISINSPKQNSHFATLNYQVPSSVTSSSLNYSIDLELQNEFNESLTKLIKVLNPPEEELVSTEYFDFLPSTLGDTNEQTQSCSIEPESEIKSESIFSTHSPSSNQTSHQESISQLNNYSGIEIKLETISNEQPSSTTSLIWQQLPANSVVRETAFGIICVHSEYAKLPFLQMINHQTNFNINRLDFLLSSLSNTFLFRVITMTFNLQGKQEIYSKYYDYLAVIDCIEINLKILNQLPLCFKPFYYLFGGRSRVVSSMADYKRVPLYFIFTTASHLIQYGKTEEIKSIIPFMSNLIQRIINSGQLLTPIKQFYKEQFKKEFGYSQNEFSTYTNYIRYDITTVSFIYNEMKNNTNKKLTEFFSTVWNECTSKSASLINYKFIATNLVILVPTIQNEMMTNSFDLSARKLYQIKYTEIVFGEWNSFEQLNESYCNLRADFKSLPIDFRLRAFGEKDFAQLKDSLKRLVPLVTESLKNKLTINLNFFIELEYFVLVKSFVFIMDICKDTSQVKKYKSAFESIAAIEKLFTQLRIFLPIVVIQVKCMEEGKDQLLSLKRLVQQFPCFDSISLNDSIAILSTKFKRLVSYVSNFWYIGRDLGYFKNVARLNCLELIDKIHDALFKDDLDTINQIFSNDKYANYREFWSFIPIEAASGSDGGARRDFLEQFRMFLFLYSQ